MLTVFLTSCLPKSIEFFIYGAIKKKQLTWLLKIASELNFSKVNIDLKYKEWNILKVWNRM